MKQISPIVVCGLPRCGSSLTLQMLDAAGVPVVGEYPIYEPGLEFNEELVATLDGKAFKILDPHENELPMGPSYRFIFLTRSRRQQTLSHLKMLRLTQNLKGRITDSDIALYEESLAKDRVASFEKIRTYEGRTITIGFEDLVARTGATVNRIAWFLGLDSTAEERMAKCVVPRSVSVYPGMLELDLIQDRKNELQA